MNTLIYILNLESLSKCITNSMNSLIMESTIETFPFFIATNLNVLVKFVRFSCHSQGILQNKLENYWSRDIP